MPTHHHYHHSRCDGVGRLNKRKKTNLTENECLQILRRKEVLAYHYICCVFRAQGHLTPEKLKLLKEVASALYITESRHKAQCCIAVNDRELATIAECVAGPNNDVEWLKEAKESNVRQTPHMVQPSYALKVADAVAAAARKALRLAKDSDDPDTIYPAQVKLKAHWFGGGEDDSDTDSESSSSSDSDSCGEVVDGGGGDDQEEDDDDDEDEDDDDDEDQKKKKKKFKPGCKEDKDDKDDRDHLDPNGQAESVQEEKSSSDLSPTDRSPAMPENKDSTVGDQTVEELTKQKAEADKALMPPPPPVVIEPPTIVASVITVPPPVPSLPPPPIIIVPPSAPLITVPPPTDEPPQPIVPVPLCTISNPIQVPSVVTSELTYLTPPPETTAASPQNLVTQQAPIQSEPEDMQFLSFSGPLDSLPPLVVVPPAEPVITVPHSSSFSPSLSPSHTVQPSTLILPSGMSIQLREDADAKNRKRPLPQDGGLNSGASAPKTLAISQVSKVNSLTMTGTITTQGQLKVTPAIARNKMATLPPTKLSTNLSTSTQKVIIVSNSSAAGAPMIQRSINVPVGVPIIRAGAPRQHTPTARGGGITKLRPKMVTVPAKTRAKGSPLIIPHNYLKNTITLKQDTMTVMDTTNNRMNAGLSQAKILPKPQGSMFIVNSTQSTQKMTTTVAGGGPTTRMISPRMITQGTIVDGATGTTTLKSIGSKQNVVILQKGGGGGQRALTLTNTSKDLMQKLMSKKCVVIQSGKSPAVIQASRQAPTPPPTPTPTLKPAMSNQPKNITQKLTSPMLSTSTGNVVVLDLSQEQYQQHFNTTTIAEILQASGAKASSSGPTIPKQQAPLTTAPPVPTSETNWLTTEATKSLSLEEISLPIGQTEAIVTLDKAVDLLGEHLNEAGDMMNETVSLNAAVELMSVPDNTDHMFNISPGVCLTARDVHRHW